MGEKPLFLVQHPYTSGVFCGHFCPDSPGVDEPWRWSVFHVARWDLGHLGAGGEGARRKIALPWICGSIFKKKGRVCVGCWNLLTQEVQADQTLPIGTRESFIYLYMDHPKDHSLFGLGLPGCNIPIKNGRTKVVDIQSHHQLSPESFGEWFFKAYFAGPNAPSWRFGGWIHRQKQTHDPKDPPEDSWHQWHRYLLEVSQQTGLHFSWPFFEGGTNIDTLLGTSYHLPPKGKFGKSFFLKSVGLL